MKTTFFHAYLVSLSLLDGKTPNKLIPKEEFLIFSSYICKAKFPEI